MGDSVDNIPGVAGIGDKGARDLVREFGTVEAVLDNADKVKRAAYREGLKTPPRGGAPLQAPRHPAPATLPSPSISRRLKRHEPDRAAAHALFSELEFQAIAQGIRARRQPLGRPPSRGRLGGRSPGAGGRGSGRGPRVPGHRRAPHPEPHARAVLGLALAIGPRRRSLRAPRPRSASKARAEVAPGRALALLQPLLEDASVRKLSANAKRDLVLLARAGRAWRGLDLRRARWRPTCSIPAGAPTASTSSPSSSWTSAAPRAPRPRVRARRSKPRPQTAGQDADVVLRMADLVTARLAEEQLDAVYAGMEMPLVAGARRPGARRGQDRHRPPRAR